METDPNISASPNVEAKRNRTFLQGAGRLLLRLGIAVLVLVVLALIVLQTPWGKNTVRVFVEKQATASLGGALSIGTLGGNLITGAELQDVSLSENDSTVVLIRDATITYRLWSLLFGEIVIPEVTVSGLTLSAAQRADSTWNILRVLNPPKDEPPSVAEPWTIRIDKLTVENVSGVAQFYDETAPDIVFLDSFSTRGSDWVINETVVGRLESLGATVRWPDRVDRLDVSFAGAIDDLGMTVDSLAASSNLSKLAGAGRLDWPVANSPNESDFLLSATPFSFRDVQPFLPFLSPDETVELTMRVTAPKNGFNVELDADFASGSTLNLSTDIDLFTDGPVHYWGQGDANKLNLTYLLGDATLATNLTGSFGFDFSGTDLTAISGSGNLRLDPESRWLEKAIGPAQLEVQILDGLADGSLAARADRSSVDADFQGRFFSDVPDYQVEGSFRDFDWMDFVPGAVAGDVRMTGVFDLEGTSFDLASLVANATITAGTSTFYGTEVHSANLVAEIKPVGIDLLLDAVGKTNSSLSLDGTIDPYTFEYEIRESEVVGLNLRDFMGPTAVRSDLSFLLSGAGKGFDPQTMDFEAIVELRPSRYDVYDLDSGRLLVDYRQATALFDVTAAGGGSNLEAVGRLMPLTDPMEYSIESSSFRNLDLSWIFPDAGFAGVLTGSATASGAGFDPETLSFSGRATLSDSSFDQYRIENADATVRVNRGDIQFNIDGVTNAGALDIAGSVRPFARDSAVTLESGSFRNLDLAQILDDQAYGSRLNGKVESFSMTGDRFSTLAADAVVNLDQSTFQRQVIDSGRVQLASMDGTVSLSARLDAADGSTILNANVLFEDEVPVYDVSGTISGMDFTRWLPDSTHPPSVLNAVFEAAGRGVDPETMTLTGSMTGTGSSYGDIRLDSLATDVSMAEGTVNVNRFRLVSNVGDLTGSGPAVWSDLYTGQESDFAFTGYLKNAGPLRSIWNAEYVAGEGAFRGYIRGTSDDLRLRVTTVNDGLQLLGFESYRIGSVRGQMTAERQRGQWAVQVDTRLANISVPGYLFQDARVEGEYADSTIAFDGQFTLDERLDGTFKGKYQLVSEEVERLDLETLGFKLGQSSWTLPRETAVQRDGGRWSFENIQMEAGDQRMSLNGVLDFAGTQNLSLLVDNVSVDGAADLFGFPELGGVFSGNLQVGGSAESPEFSATLHSRAILSAGVPVGGISADMTYRDRRLDVDAFLTHIQGDSLLVNGYVPANLSLAESANKEEMTGDVDLTIKTSGFRLDWANPLVDANLAREISGLLSGNVHVGGVFEKPDIRGEMNVHDAALRIPFLGTRYKNGVAAVRFEGDVARVESLSIDTGLGGLKAVGTVSLNALNLGTLDLDLTTERFEAINDDDFVHAVVTGTATLKGTTLRPVLDGDVLLDELEIMLSSELMESARESVVLSERDLQEIEARYGIRPTSSDTTNVTFYQSTDVRLRARSNGNAWMRSRFNPRMNIEMRGELDFRKPSMGTEVVFGELEAVKGRSWVNFVRKFDIATGEISFNGDMLNPTMNIQAQYKGPAQGQRETQTILLNLTGDITDATFDFESDPPMEDAQILEYLAFGRAVQNVDQAAGQNLGEDLATDYGYSLVEALVSQQAQQRFGLDLVEIKPDEEDNPSLTLGRYVSRRFFMSLTSRLTDDPNPYVVFEYQARRWVLLRIQQDTESLPGLFVLLEYSY